MVTYKDAGVDLAKHREVHAHASAFLGGSAGYYTRSVALGGLEVTMHVDGVGTKALLALQAGRLRVVGWDCVMVNVNDVVCDGYRPVAVVDYIAVSPGHEDAAKPVIEGVAEAASRVGAVLLGGETAILPDLVNGLDASCTVLAVREARTGRAEPGDSLVAIASTGPHANGYSLLRRLFRLGEEVCGARAEDALLAPVANYLPVLDLIRDGVAKAAAHITGGAFAKLARVLGGLGARLELGGVPCIFEEAVRRGVPRDEAYRVFNMGVGMVLVVPRGAEAEAVRRLSAAGLRAWEVGRVVEEPGVVVDGVRVA